ncbi:hypothetical protein ABN034_21060 [Actinopolymorpha sp. B11F2]|uniref:hypothetical protein n=1 Tax=Actinopolymorpha sp. B11F2 TaxID=3160862 RepID=UPI0032E51954
MGILLIFAGIAVLLVVLGLVQRRHKERLPWSDRAERRDFKNRLPKGAEQTLPPSSMDFPG